METTSELYRRNAAINKLNRLVKDNRDLSICNVIMTVLRGKYNTSKEKDPYYMSDVDFSYAVESVEEELKKEVNNG